MKKIATKNPDFQLWKASSEDGELVFAFMKKLGIYQKMEAAITATPEGLSHLLAKGLGEAVFGDYKNQTVAFAWFNNNCSAFIGESGIYIDAFYIDEEVRNLGLGKILFSWIAEQARSRGCKRLEWGCLDWNTPAIDFYSGFGAKCVDIMRIYRLNSETLRKAAEFN